MAELLLVVHPTPKYEDGDVLCAFNRRRIRDVHAQHICSRHAAPRNGDGLIPLDAMARAYYEATHEYRFERVASDVVLRTNLFTGGLPDVCGPNAPALTERMDVRAFIARRRAHPANRLFGTPGAEVWYGGRVAADHPRLDQVWAQIEEHSPLREADHRLFPLSDYERREWLALPVEDFDDIEGAALVAPELNGVTVVRARARTVRWRDHFPHAGPNATVEDVLDRTKAVDVRTRPTPFARTIVRQKTRER